MPFCHYLRYHRIQLLETDTVKVGMGFDFVMHALSVFEDVEFSSGPSMKVLGVNSISQLANFKSFAIFGWTQGNSTKQGFDSS